MYILNILTRIRKSFYSEISRNIKNILKIYRVTCGNKFIIKNEKANTIKGKLLVHGELNKYIQAKHYANWQRNDKGASDVYYTDIGYK